MGLVCSVDESGTHDPTGRQVGSGVAIMAGCLADRHEWAALEGPWNRVLQEYRVPVLHMSEFSAQQHNPQKDRSPYYGWSNERCDKFVSELCQVVSRHRIHKIGRGVHVDDYHQAFSDDLKQVFHPWMFCFWQLMAEFVSLKGSRIAAVLNPGEQVAFLFDQHKEFGPKAHALFLRFKELLDDDGLLGSITFVSDKESCIPVQVADLVAFRTRKLETRNRNKARGTIDLEPGTWDYFLFRDNAGLAYYDGEALRRIAPGFERIPGFREWAVERGFRDL